MSGWVFVCSPRFVFSFVEFFVKVPYIVCLTSKMLVT